jgi:hypothetical protein
MRVYTVSMIGDGNPTRTIPLLASPFKNPLSFHL